MKFSRTLRRLLLKWAVDYGVEPVQLEALKRFRAVSTPEGLEKIHPDLRDIVYTAAIRTGGEVEFNILWNRYKVRSLSG